MVITMTMMMLLLLMMMVIIHDDDDDDDDDDDADDDDDDDGDADDDDDLTLTLNHSPCCRRCRRAAPGMPAVIFLSPLWYASARNRRPRDLDILVALEFCRGEELHIRRRYPGIPSRLVAHQPQALHLVRGQGVQDEVPCGRAPQPVEEFHCAAPN